MASWTDGVAAAVLAGGLGTRLRSVVADRPKVLAAVEGKPFLAHLLDQLRHAGVMDATLLVGHAADQIRAAFGVSFGDLQLTYSEEPEPLGTGGAVRLALPHVRADTVLLLNGDSYCDLDFAAFHATHAARGAIASLALARVEDASRYGRVSLAPGDRVSGFEEKSEVPAPGWINAGVYLIRRSLIEAVPPGRAASLERDLLPGWVAGGRVFGFPASDRFIDIGVPESYAAAPAFFATGTVC